MARVVQRRSNPPYLLIIFVFLFLVATALFVMKFIEADKTAKELASEREKLARVVHPQDESLVNQLSAKDPAQSVVGQLNKQVDVLVNQIVGKQATFDAAKTSVDDMYKDLGSDKERLGLVTLVMEKFKSLNDLNAQQKKLEGDLAEKSKQIADLETQKTDAKKEYEKQLDARKAEILALSKTVDADQAKLKTAMGAESEAWKAKSADFLKEIGEKASQITTLQGEVVALKAKLKKMEIAEIERNRVPSKIVAAGKVIKVKDDIAYIDMGKKSNVPMGLTLSVFSPTSIGGESPMPKAKLKVVNVFEDSSECRVTEEDPKDPLMANDVVSNLAFNTSRAYNFVVEGVFDLDGSGTPSFAGTAQVIDLIKKSGSTVSENIDRNTDYLVLGDPPAKPAKPKESNPQDEKVYNEQMKAFNHYREVEAQARTFDTKVINVARFMALIGYTPSGK
ncbi:MAG: hypothetical protein EHM48_00735 [Planctomycetaceae bacterium]|nr:MAG: hypothetical protein EHM48_00735 [Planctomycetaceae bacterium]